MHDIPEILGDVIKSARTRADITVEALADKVGIGERYLYRIENERKKPSFIVLYRLIRELAISPDLIFYPEKQTDDSDMDAFIRTLYNCNEHSIAIIKATVKATLERQTKE